MQITTSLKASRTYLKRNQPNRTSLCDSLPEEDLGSVQGDISPEEETKKPEEGSTVEGSMTLEPRKVA